ALAHSILGDISEVHSGKVLKENFAYIPTFVPGVTWDVPTTSHDDNANIAAQLARTIMRCSLEIDSAGCSAQAVVDGYVLPRLRKILETVDFTDVPEARKRLEELLGWHRIAGLKLLPLSLCHIDVNHRNIIVDNHKHITGLIDWEHANLLPLGMNAWCIRFLSVPIAGGKALAEREHDAYGLRPSGTRSSVVFHLPNSHQPASARFSRP
ncbi:hypothetical protein F5146DRAFT_935421, partial [Armillaria mellea]